MTLPPKIAFWPKKYQELWLERAALMEFDAGYSRPEAERQAEADVRRQASGGKIAPAEGLPLQFGK